MKEKLKEYCVSVWLPAGYNTRILATSEEEAISKLKEEHRVVGKSYWSEWSKHENWGEEFDPNEHLDKCDIFETDPVVEVTVNGQTMYTCGPSEEI